MSARKLTLLDGGTGTELRRRGVEIPCHRTSIWSARAVDVAPEVVKAVHLDYLHAGADVLTACNYAVTPTLLAREGMQHRLEELTLTAVELACQAREEFGGAVRVAASLPPLDTSYRADLVAEDEELRKTYAHLARLLAPRVDILLCETMSLGREAVAAATAALETDREVWLSWTLQGNRPGLLPSGESLDAVFDMASDLPVQAHLVNCCGANLITDAVQRLATLTAQKSAAALGGFANASDALPGPFDPQDPEAVPTRELSPREYADAAAAWVDGGATIVGGCCHTTPEHMAEVRSRVGRA